MSSVTNLIFLLYTLPLPILSPIAKVGFNFGDDGTISSLIIPELKKSTPFVPEDYLTYVKYLLHVIFIVIVIVVNGLMLRFYVKSMHENGAAKATVYNFAVNYLSSVRY